MSGIIFHEKRSNLNDCYKAWGKVTLPASSKMLYENPPTFVAYALFGCHCVNVGNFDVGIQVCEKGVYKLCLNGGNALKKPWDEKPFSASGESTLEVLISDKKVTLSAFNTTLSGEFNDNIWPFFNNNGVQFWKEMTIGVGKDRVTDMWISPNLERMQTVFMADLIFDEVTVKRKNNTECSLDDNCTITQGTPKLESGSTGSMPSWSQMRYGGVPTSGARNFFSIDCRP